MSANADNWAVARNALTGYGTWLVNLAIGLVVTPILLHSLGEDGFGAWTVATAITGYVALVELGLGVATSRRLASSFAVGDMDRVSAVAASARATYLVLAGMGSSLLVGVVVLSGSLPVEVGISSDRVRITILIFGLGYFVSLATMIYPVIAIGAGRVDLGMTVGVGVRLIVAVAQVAVLQISSSIVPLAVVTSLGFVGGTLAVRAVVRRRFGYIDIRMANASRHIARQLLSSGWRNAAIVATFAVAFQADVLVVGVILGSASVAGYGVAVRAATMIGALSTRAADVLVPTFAHTTTLKDNQRTLSAYCESVFLARAILLPALIALIAFGEPLLHLWLREVPAGAYGVLVLLVLGTAVAAPGYSAYVLLTGMDRLTYLLVGSSIAAVANLCLSIVLTWRLGIIGPALGSLAAFAIWDAIFLPRYIGSLIGVPWLPLSAVGLRSLAAPCVAASAVALVCVEGLGWTAPRQGLLGAVAVGLMFVAVLWATLDADRRRRYRALFSRRRAGS